MSKKSTQKTESKSVTTPTNPQFVTDSLQKTTGLIDKVAGLDPSSLVAGVNPLQQQAADGAAGLGADRSWLDSILSAPNLQPRSLLTNLEDYMSPYRQQVIDTSLADYDFGADKTRAAQDLELAGAGAFGGSGSALTRSATEGELNRGRGSLAAGLRDQGFSTAANLSNLDAQRAQQTDLANLEALFQRGNLAMGAEASDRANLGTMMGIGDSLRGIDAQQRNAPISLASVLAGLQGSMPYSLLHGQEQTGSSTTTSKTSDPMGALGSLAMLAAAPLTGGTSLLGMGMQGLGALGSLGGGLGAAGSALASSSALGGLAGDLGFISQPRYG